MTNRLTSFAVMLTALSLGACATITRGTETAWQVNTVPAGASITTSNDKVCEQTPCAIITPRKQAFVATVTKEGYLPQTVPVESRFSTAGGLALLGNVWIGGLIGIFTDTYTGSTHDLTPTA